MTDFDYQNTGSMDQEISDTDEYYTTIEVGNKFAKNVVALMIVIPLLVIFSPVLAAAFPLATVFLASGVVSVTAARVMEWLSKNVTGGHHKRANLSQPYQSGDRKAGRSHFDMVYDDRYVTGYESLDKTLSLLIHVVKESFINSVGGVYGKALRWIYKYVKGEHPTGADTLDRAMRKVGSKVREMRDQDRYGGDKHELAKAAAGGSLVFLSALTFTGTVITLAMAAPVFVIFSPVLVPALITMFLLAIGFLSSAMSGVAGVSALTWLYKYLSGGGQPMGAELLDQVLQKFGLKELWGEGSRAIGGDQSYGKTSDAKYTGGVDFCKLMKAGTATTAGILLLSLSGLTFTWTVIGLTLVTPLLVIFSPVLVPAMVTVFLLVTGFLTGGVFGGAGAVVLAWMYKYANSGPSTSEKLLNLEIRGTSEHTIRGDHTATEDGQKFMRSVVILLVASPLLLILSPLLVPMMIAILMLGTLCLAAGAFSAVATKMFEWAYNSFHDGWTAIKDGLNGQKGTHKLGLRERGEQKIEGAHYTAAVGGGSGLSMT